MKSYVSEGQFRLVGKAWEIKLQLNQLIHQYGSTTTLTDYLHRSTASHRPLSQGRSLGAHLVPFPLN